MKRRLLATCCRQAQAANNPDQHPDWGTYHHFAFIIQDGRIVAWATNARGPKGKSFGYPGYAKIHAEQRALYRAKGKLTKKPFICVNIRLSANGAIKNSKPCKACQRLLRSHGCVKVWHTNQQQEFEQLEI